MPFILLFVLMLACLPVQWPEPAGWVGIRGSILLTWGNVALILGTAWGLAAWTRGQLARDPARREATLTRYAAGRLYHTLALFTMFGVTLYGLGWGWAVQYLTALPRTDGGQSWEVPGAELIILAPFLVSLIGSWFFYYDAERALHDAGRGAEEADPYWTRGTYLLFHLRHNLALVFAPIALLMLADSILHVWPHLERDPRFQVFALLLLAGVFAAMPWVLRLVLGLSPLPAGPLRQRLLAAGQRLHFRCSDILVWNTHGGVANAMVVGVLPWPRYVLLTDRLIEELTPAEVEAVFGHEVGHIKHRHMIYYLSFLLVSLCVVSEMWKAADLESLLDLTARQDLAILPRIAVLGAYIFVVFGFLSRRCEGQADIYGCRAVSCQRGECYHHDETLPLAPGGQGLCPTGICTFINALEKVAYLNGMSRDRPGWLQSWQHSTIARRVEFLERILRDPGVEPRFQRMVFLTKSGLLLGLLAMLGVLACTQGWQTLLAL